MVVVTWMLVKTHLNVPLTQVHTMGCKCTWKCHFSFCLLQKKEKKSKTLWLPAIHVILHWDGVWETIWINFASSCESIIISKSKAEKGAVAEIGGGLSNAFSINIEHLILLVPRAASERDHTSAPWSLWSNEESRWRKGIEIPFSSV